MTQPLSDAQARVVLSLWETGRWSVLEIARYLGVSPWRVNTGQAREGDHFTSDGGSRPA